MNNLSKYIIEKLHLDKNTNPEESWSDIKKKVRTEFKNEDSITTLKFLLNFIKRSRKDKFKLSIFNYWEMYILKNKLVCMHPGWSRSSDGHRKISYVQKVIDNYNKDNNTKIDGSFSGWSIESKEGVSIFNIEEVVNALKEKYDDFEIDNDKELVEVGL